MYDIGKAYLFWLLSLVGLSGVHRLYLGKIGSGILWIFTGGLFGIGALYDLVTLPAQVREANMRAYYRAAVAGQAPVRLTMPADQAEAAAPRRESLERVILKCARRNAGYVTASEAALEGDISLDAAKTALDKLAAKGFAEMRIRTNGVVVYVFPEFQKEGAGDFVEL
jgi:TM2 domain-containing membrane protein YozV